MGTVTDVDGELLWVKNGLAYEGKFWTWDFLPFSSTDGAWPMWRMSEPAQSKECGIEVKRHIGVLM